MLRSANLATIGLVLLAVEASAFPGHSEYAMKTPKCPHLLPKAEQKCPIHSRYQSVDGKCNNPVKSNAGATFTPLRRILPPDYGDGIQSLRRARNGDELPNSRLISTKFSESGVDQIESSVYSHMFVLLGQFLAHDTVKTEVEKEADQTEVKCDCESNRPECLKIPVPPDDEEYQGERLCIPMVRSLAYPGTSCAGKPRQQTNSLTAYWDGNTVYGSDDELSNELRDPDSDIGEMLVRKSKRGHKADSLPTLGQITKERRVMFACPKHLHKNKKKCFAGGEARINENQGLMSLHMIFMREHNRIARQLRQLNPLWTADDIFQETRRIIAAITQRITYSEFLPTLIGIKNVERYDLQMLEEGYYFGYDATYDASISNVWATAAFRYGHSMVKAQSSQLDPSYRPESEPVPTHKTLFNPSDLLNVSANRDRFVIRGFVDDAAENADTYVNEELRSKMFLSETKLGLDLFAINVERGRDHGIPGFNRWREYCGLQKALSIESLNGEIEPEKIQVLSELYRDIEDIDVLVGGLAEAPSKGAAVGPTFVCLIAEQFRALRKGDKSWFENPGYFSFSQLQEIRKVTLAGIICQNVMDMKTIQPNVMILDSVAGNVKIPCEDILQMSFSPWKNDSEWHDAGVFTRWFPMHEGQESQEVLERELAWHSDQVCRGPLSYETEYVRMGIRRIRFKCARGSVTSSDFPKSVPDHAWTVWFDRDSPSYSNGDDVESLDRLLIERSQDLCAKPLFMQARTHSMTMALENNEVLEYYGAHGLVCKGRHQLDRKCSDYSVRFLCPKEFFENQRRNSIILANEPGASWTPWTNIDGAYGKGDFESPALSRFLGNAVCRNPILIEGRIFGTDISATDTDDVLKRYGPLQGLQCVNHDQLNRDCHDYEVRYLCSVK